MENGDEKRKEKEQIRIERVVRGLYIYFRTSKEKRRSSSLVVCWDGCKN